MKPIVLAAGLLLACFVPSAHAAAGWFVPQLAAGDPAECAPMLTRMREEFSGNGRWDYEAPLGAELQGMHALPPVGVEETREAATGTRQIKNERLPGCGGACERQTKTVLSDGKAVFTTPDAIFWAEYSDGKARDYFIGVTSGHLEAYAVTGNGTPACRIALEPDFKKVTDSDVLGALRAVDSLDAASIGMSRPGGFCGSLRTDGRWADNIRQALHQALYRPWALVPWTNPSENSYGDYDRILPQLTLWSLGGFSERAAFQRYIDRIATTEKILADFYVKQFGWKVPEAQSMAHAALTNAISSGFGFYNYRPFENEEEARLRAALFAHAPMDQIRAIPLDVKIIDPVMGRDWPELPKDSLLNVAIAYPEALRYLLDKGFDPNRANAFGKTPLMYAAQYNQLEAARLLLKAGADPNARTSAPPFDCGFRLSTTGTTPLHYAVRNAATPLIGLLLQSGAAPFIKAYKDDGKNKPGSTPLDWLRLYTSGEPGKEQNHNLTTRDTAALEKDLTPDPAVLARIATAKVLLGEKEAMAGHDEAAYQAISVALQADPSNQKGLADLPLLALKTKRPGEAAAAATRATTDLKTEAAKASAWFNLGLTCEKQNGSLRFQGAYYCEGNDRIYPFLRAWQIAPTDSRTKKLLQLMETPTETGRIGRVTQSCFRSGRLYRVMTRYGKDMHATSVYALHPKNETIDPLSVSWTGHWAGKPDVTVTPHLAGRHVLGEKILTVLENEAILAPVTIEGAACG
jgi:hypothetical protein